jgi:fructose-1,6-bisphosphatase/inositol monophosphatase family enzyme
MEFDIQRFESTSIEMVIKGMEVVRRYQLRDETLVKATVKKEDNTLLTIEDQACGKTLRDLLKRDFPHIRNSIEDVETYKGTSTVVIYGDPIDGTAAFTAGLPTSTVILGAYDTEKKEMLACTIGEPSSGRIWHTCGGKSYYCVWDFSRAKMRNVHPVITWKGILPNKDTFVFLDHPRGFVRSGRQILSGEQAGRLLNKLAANYRLLLPGSNGLHQALVAQGNDRMAGAITSAIGGPQDVCGVQLVLNAGGAARAFRMLDRPVCLPTMEPPLLYNFFEEVSPLAIEEYDILVVGNNQRTVNELEEVLYSSMLLGMER